VPGADVAGRSGTDAFGELRPLMFSIAYRMVGSVSEAEDIVQDAYLRLYQGGRLDPGSGANAEPLRSPEAYAATVTTRLAIDHLRSARVRREAYVGPWLPEPLLTDPGADPAHEVERDESLSMAVLALLERLSPVERAVFVLREVFEYQYEDIAAVVGKEPDNCRQIMTRARRHIEAGRPRFEPRRERRSELARRFLAALDEGDVAGLERVLADDVAFYGDGGGKAPAIKKPIYGRTKVLRFLLGLARQGHEMRLLLEPVEVNGQPGFRALDQAGRLINVVAFDIVAGAIAAMYNVLNPDKLRHLGPVADLNILLSERAKPIRLGEEREQSDGA
jgi:RNA polymerase sigma-70 factor (TIGR02957 family)